MARIWHGFFQDDFKVANSLTLNLGFRYEYTPWLTGYKGQAAAFDPTREKSIIVSSKTNDIDLSVQRLADVGYALFSDLIQTSSQAGVPLNITKNDMKQIGPRLGFAWRPFGDDMVVRGGYGIFYEAEGTDGRLNFNFIPFRVSETLTAAVNAVPNRTLADYWLGVPVGASVGLGDLGAAAARSATRTRSAVEPRHPAAAVQSHRAGSRLCGHDRQPPDRGREHQPAAGGRRKRAGAAAVSAVRQPVRADAGTVERLSGAADQAAAAAGARVSGISSRTPTPSRRAGCLPRRSAATTPTNASPSRGTSRTCSPPAMATSCRLARDAGSCRMPVAVANAIVGGWQFQNIISYRSGLPYTPTVSRDVANIGVGGQRPNRVGSGELENPTIDLWFDKTAFVVPANFTFGDSGPGILRSDHQWNVDMSLFKRFEIRAGQTFEFRAEVFNVLNSTYFSGPNTNIDTAAGGRVTSTSNQARQIQFGFKYVF